MAEQVFVGYQKMLTNKVGYQPEHLLELTVFSFFLVECTSPALRADSLPSEAAGKPKNVK